MEMPVASRRRPLPATDHGEICDVSTRTRCKGCGVTSYCNKAHQKEGWPRHKFFCERISKVRASISAEAKFLHSFPGDTPGAAGAASSVDSTLPPGDLFETHAGRFHAFEETMSYINNCFKLVLHSSLEPHLKCDQTIVTRAMASMARHHISEMMRLTSSRFEPAMVLWPALLLCLDEDQECFDFVKWYATERHITEWVGDLNVSVGNLPPWLSNAYAAHWPITSRDADPFKRLTFQLSTDHLLTGYLSFTFTHMLLLVLLKIRLLQDLRHLFRVKLTVARITLPEIFEAVVFSIPQSSVVRARSDLVRGTPEHLLAIIKSLKAQVMSLCLQVERNCPPFWRMLVYRENFYTTFSGLASCITMPGDELATVAADASISALYEEPGALEVIQDLLKQGILKG